ncbi:MAG: hypothetical protein ACXWWC_08740 [Chitinophagaceae bacterium]
MKKIIVSLLATFIINLSSPAQDKFVFHSQNWVGLIEGQAGSAFQLQTINGVQNKGWFTGVGTGLDYYRYRSIPLFINISKFLFTGQKFFVSGNGGVNFPWLKSEASGWNIISVNYPAKVFFESGIGYKIGKSGNGMIINAGYSYKHIREKIQVTNPCTNSPCPELYEKNDYHLRRVSLKIGYMF